ncbi:MAG: MBL fold metallo-hydrolase [Candidatus Thermoplasmatota archaeon]|nr:MBL fold metallo-hydrolase [Candidatus Thermoplasmatota archaeon]
MAEEVEPGIFRIELPLPGNPLRSINSYVITGEDQNLIIDTGMNRPECVEVLDRELSSLDLDLSRTDVFVTHLHADHLGLAPHISRGRTKVHMGPDDIDNINATGYWSRMLNFALKNGFPSVDPQEAIRKHPGYRYGPLGPMNLVPAKDGDIFRVGDRRLRVVHTPGHTRGHNCLYEEKENILLSGDHILGDITPNISCWTGEEDPLSDYLSSLKLVKGMEIDTVLPGHRSVVRDPRKRIDELVEHHKERAREVLDIIGGDAMNTFSIASRMTWDLTYKNFDEFPVMQKWFALGEAIAHIRYLETGGRVVREMTGDRIIYRAASSP